jgi:hypothetical protein
MAGRLRAWGNDFIRPNLYARHRVLAVFLMLLAVFMIFFTGLNPLSGVLALVSTLLFPALLLWAALNQVRPEGHFRFIPLPILAVFRKPLLPKALILWAGAAAAAFFILPGGNAAYRGTAFALGDIPGQEAWERHAAFQRSFSTRPLSSGAGEAPLPYLNYTLGADGLIMPVETGESSGPAVERPLPFEPQPLLDLAAFLEGRVSGGASAAGNSGSGMAAFSGLPFDPAALAPVLIIVLLSVPVFFGNRPLNGRGGTGGVYGGKRSKQIAA